MKQIGRLLTAMVTPFDEKGAVDYEQAKKLALALINSGSDGVVVVGTTGESPTLVRSEELRLFKEIKAAVGDKGCVVAGTGSNSTAEAVEATREAEKIGVDACLLVVPYYNNPTQDGLYQHFKKIADSTSLPCILYNVPSRTAVSLAPETVAALAKLPHVAGIKEAGGMAQANAVMALTDLPLISGDDDLTLPLMALGAVGVISVTANAAPGRVKAMVQAAEGGDWAGARALHHRLHALNGACFWESSPGPVKAMLAMMGRIRPGLREPLVPPGTEMRGRLRRLLVKEGLAR